MLLSFGFHRDNEFTSGSHLLGRVPVLLTVYFTLLHIFHLNHTQVLFLLTFSEAHWCFLLQQFSFGNSSHMFGSLCIILFCVNSASEPHLVCICQKDAIWLVFVLRTSQSETFSLFEGKMNLSHLHKYVNECDFNMHSFFGSVPSFNIVHSINT